MSGCANIISMSGRPVLECVVGKKIKSGDNGVKNNNAKTRWVDPIREIKDVKKVTGYLQSKVDMAPHAFQRKIAARNKLIFILGTRIGIRVSDLQRLQWKHFFTKSGTYHINPQNIKEQKTGKLKHIFATKDIQLFINEYISTVDPDIIQDDYIFTSNKVMYELYDVGINSVIIDDVEVHENMNKEEFRACKHRGLTKDQMENISEILIKRKIGFQSRRFHITEAAIQDFIKDFAETCGLTGNYNTHSLRKTSAYQLYMSHIKNGMDMLAAVNHVRIFLNHQNINDTLRYLGIKQENEFNVLNQIDWEAE